MTDKNERVLTRREFARRAAVLSATAPLATAEAVFPRQREEASPQAVPTVPKLSDASQAEADSRFDQIIGLYGKRFDDTQKADLKKMSALLQPSLERIRSFALQNGAAPALYLKPLVEREKKAQAAPAAKQS